VLSLRAVSVNTLCLSVFPSRLAKPLLGYVEFALPGSAIHLPLPFPKPPFVLFFAAVTSVLKWQYPPCGLRCSSLPSRTRSVAAGNREHSHCSQRNVSRLTAENFSPSLSQTTCSLPCEARPDVAVSIPPKLFLPIAVGVRSPSQQSWTPPPPGFSPCLPRFFDQVVIPRGNLLNPRVPPTIRAISTWLPF